MLVHGEKERVHLVREEARQIEAALVLEERAVPGLQGGQRPKARQHQNVAALVLEERAEPLAPPG